MTEAGATAPDPNARRVRLYAPYLCFIAAAFLLYGRCLWYDFTNWDDQFFVGENPYLQRCTWENALYFLTPGRFEREMLYIPVTYLSFLLDTALFGHSSLAFHFTNIMLHGVNAALVWRLLMLLRLPRYAAGWAAVVFLVHPSQIEAIAWVMGRKDVLSTFLSLLGLIAYVKAEGEKRRQRLAAAVIAAVLAVLAKPTCVVLGVLYVMTDWRLDRGWHRERLAAGGAALVLGAAAMLANPMTNAAAEGAVGGTAGEGVFSLLAILTMIGARLMLFSPPCVTFLAGTPAEALAAVIAGWLVVALVLVGLAWRRRLDGSNLFLAAAVLILAPALARVLFFLPQFADRYTYFAIAMFAAYLASMFEAASEGARRWVWLVACLWLVVAVGRTVGSTAAWQDSESLWLDSIRKYPQHTIAYHNLASHRMNVGRRSDAIQVLSMQLEREPANAGGWHAIAALLLKDGQAEVLTACSRALLLSADPATLKLSRQIAARSWEGDPAVDKLRFWLLQRLYRSGRILDARDLAAHYGTPKSAREQLLRQRIDSAGSATDD